MYWQVGSNSSYTLFSKFHEIQALFVLGDLNTPSTVSEAESGSSSGGYQAARPFDPVAGLDSLRVCP